MTTQVNSFPKVLAIVLLSVMLFTACVPTTPAPPPTKAVEPATEVVPPIDTGAAATDTAAPVAKPSGKLVIWAQKANQDVWEKTALAGFKAKYPDITLEIVNNKPVDIASQVGLAIQGGTGVPDLAVTEYRSITALVELGGLADVTPIIAPYKADLNATMMGYCSKDGKVYCIPWDIGPVVTFYRRDIFEAAGLKSDPDSVSAMLATYDDYLATCKTIKAKTKLDCFSLSKAKNTGEQLENMLWQQGLGYYDASGKVTIDSPYVVDAVKKLGEFWKADVVSDTEEWTDPWYAELKSGMDNKETPPVATIVIAAWMGNFLKTWVAAEQTGNWGVALMPAYKAGGTRSSNQGGSAYFIPKDAKNPDAARAFIEYMNLDTANQVAEFVYSDYFPGNSATYADPVFQMKDPYFHDQVTRAFYADVAKQIPYGYIYGQYAGTMTTNVAKAVQNYALGNKSAEDALKEAADAVRLETGMP